MAGPAGEAHCPMGGTNSRVPWTCRAASLKAAGPGRFRDVGEPRAGTRAGIGLEGATKCVVGDCGWHPLVHSVGSRRSSRGPVDPPTGPKHDRT